MIEMKNIEKCYETGEEKIRVLKGIDLAIAQGEFTAIMGPSGSGKTSLINTISFLDGDFSGAYTFNGADVYAYSDDRLSEIRNQTVGFVFQSFHLIENNTVFENVELPLLYAGLSHKEAKDEVEAVLEQVGISNKADKLPRQLSGGQQQRTAIARALANCPNFIVADEPTGALDSATSEEILTLFSELNQNSGVTILMVTHDSEAAAYCRRVIEVRDGKVIEMRGH